MSETKEKKETQAEKQLRILECMKDVLKDNGFRAELSKSEQDPNQPPILRLEQSRTGKIMQDICMEICFIPMQMPTEGMALLQFYTTLFHGLRPEFEKEVRKACEYCNDYCAVGAFSYFTPAQQLYLKHNTVLDTRGDLEQIVTIIAENISLALASVQRFIDAFAAISNGVMTVDTAIAQELLPQI